MLAAQTIRSRTLRREKSEDKTISDAEYQKERLGRRRFSRQKLRPRLIEALRVCDVCHQFTGNLMVGSQRKQYHCGHQHSSQQQEIRVTRA